MLPAARGVYPPGGRGASPQPDALLYDSGDQVDVDYMPAASGFSPWGGRAGAEPPRDAASRPAQLSAQRAVQAEQEGYDAFCPFGTLDIGVREARTCVQSRWWGRPKRASFFAVCWTARSPVAPICPAVKTASAPGRATRALRPCWWPIRPSASQIRITPSAARNCWTVSWPCAGAPGAGCGTDGPGGDVDLPHGVRGQGAVRGRRAAGAECPGLPDRPGRVVAPDWPPAQPSAQPVWSKNSNAPFPQSLRSSHHPLPSCITP